MKLTQRLAYLLVLLLTGSASLHAQGADPFPEPNEHDYQGTMLITAKVVDGATTLTDAVLAVYVGDEIRGKSKVGNGTDAEIAYTTVYGNYTLAPQYLHFKVYTSGVVYDVVPNPQPTYKFNGELGSRKEPYVVDIAQKPACTLVNNGDNSETIAMYNGVTADVTLDGRTLYKDGMWNTICLPFDVTIAGSALDGATCRELTAASITGSTLYLTFGDAVTTIEAGRPYIIKWTSGDAIVSPVFTKVTLSDADRSYDNGGSGAYRVRFIGTYQSTVYGAEDKSILLMRDANTLRYPLNGATLGAMRAYIKLGDEAAPARQLANVSIDFGDEEQTTGIVGIQHPSSITQHPCWVSLDGRKLDSKPTRRGLYIYQGRKTLIK